MVVYVKMTTRQLKILKCFLEKIIHDKKFVVMDITDYNTKYFYIKVPVKYVKLNSLISLWYLNNRDYESCVFVNIQPCYYKIEPVAIYKSNKGAEFNYINFMYHKSWKSWFIHD